MLHATQCGNDIAVNCKDHIQPCECCGGSHPRTLSELNLRIQFYLLAQESEYLSILGSSEVVPELS